MRFVNEYKYNLEDTFTALNAYNHYWKRKLVGRYGALVLAAVSAGLYLSTGLMRFIVFMVILLLVFGLSFLQVFLGAKFDAARMKEDTGMPDPAIRYELDNELRVYRNGNLYVNIPLEDIYGAKEVRGALVVFTKGNLTALFKDDGFLEGGPTALRAFLRDKGATIK